MMVDELGVAGEGACALLKVPAGRTRISANIGAQAEMDLMKLPSAIPVSAS
jgi:hypothetical protein